MAKRRNIAGAQPTGVPVDASGGPTVDPTANVIALTAAQDRFTQMQIGYVEKLAELRADHLSEMSAIRSLHAEKLALAEAGRIDAINAVNVNLVAVAAQKAQDQASVLATQLVTTADSSRSALAIATAQAADMLRQTLEPVMARLTTLEQSRSASSGASDNTKTMIYGAVALIGLGLAFLTYSNRATSVPFALPPGYTLTAPAAAPTR